MNNKELYRELHDIFEETALEVLENPFFNPAKLSYFEELITNLGIESDKAYREIYSFIHRVAKEPSHPSDEYIKRILSLIE